MGRRRVKSERPRATRDPQLWRRRFLGDPMRRILRALDDGMVSVVREAGYPEIRVQHLHVFAHVPRDEGMRMSALAERLQLTPGAVTQLVDQLVELGLVERRPDPDDGRAARVVPTADAEAGYEAGRRFLAQREDEWRGVVGERRWATFRKVLAEIADHEEGARRGERG